MIALIMAGGSGTRFWPLSRRAFPKQFLQIAGEKSMIRLTVDRLLPLIPIHKIFIVTAKSQVELIKKHLPDLPIENVIIEPFGMNTAPCIGLSVSYIRRFAKPEEMVIVLPSDHIIRDEKKFLESLEKAEKPATEGNLVVFGIEPDYPATGYGYIEAGAAYGKGMYQVVRFKEKPNVETASQFLDSGNFYWNSGMFCFQLSTIIDNYSRYMPQVMELLEEIEDIWASSGTHADIVELYSLMPKIPVDIGIMEKAEKRVVMPVAYGWSDVGSWRALAELLPKDEEQNRLECSAYAIDSHDNFVRADKFVALIGVEDLVVVDTDDALLIAKKEMAEDVKKVVEFLQKQDEFELT